MPQIPIDRCHSLFNQISEQFPLVSPEFADRHSVDSAPVLAPPHTRLFGEPERVHKQIQAATSTDCVHIGLGGMVNLGYAAKAPDGVTLLIDRNHAQTVFWRHMINALKTNASHQAFINGLDEMVFNVRNDFIKLKDTGLPIESYDDTVPLNGRYVPYDVLRDGSPCELSLISGAFGDIAGVYGVGNDRDYAALHNMAAQGRMAALTLSLTDRNGFQTLKKCFDTAGVQATQFYTSNVVCAFLEKDRGFYKDKTEHPLTIARDNVALMLGAHAAPNEAKGHDNIFRIHRRLH